MQAASSRHALAGLTVGDLMIRDPITVDAHATVQQLIDDVFYPTRHTAFPVTDGDAPVGLVSFRQALALPRDRWGATPVEEIMAPARDAQLGADISLADALPRLTASELPGAIGEAGPAQERPR
jgi:CBS domain-containing protein